MARMLLRSFVALIIVVVISMCFLATRLLAGSHQNGRVHLNARYPDLGRHNRLLHPRMDRRQDEGWVREFVLGGDVAHPHRQLPLPRKLDAASDSIPDSGDDNPPIPGKIADSRAVVQAIAGRRDDEMNRVENNFAEGHDDPVVPDRHCSPEKTNVAMIKTHKCSSSTLQNILLRKTEEHNLTLALPREGVYLGSPNYFDRRFILGDNGSTRYNVMASHMRFRRPRDVKEVMAPDAKYITILRNPAEQYESIFTYYNWARMYRADMRTFLAHPEHYFRVFEPQKARVAGRNPMCYDNGLDARSLEPGDGKVDAFIEVLGRWYDLVLIAEYFEESLILLRELMCWTLDDVVFFSQNARNKMSVVPLSNRDRRAIHRWNWADALLYEHFNSTLWARIDRYGRARMAREVTELRRKNEALAQDCIEEVLKEGDQRVWYPPGIKVNSFRVNKNASNQHLCEQLTRPELTYLKFFRDRKFAELYGPDFLARGEPNRALRIAEMRRAEIRRKVEDARNRDRYREKVRHHWARIPH